MPRITLDEYREAFDFPVIEYYRTIGFDLEKYSFEMLSDEFISAYIASRKNLKLQPGAQEALNFFKARNVLQCMLSASQSEALRQTLIEHNVHNFFHTVLGLDHHYADGKAHLGQTWLKNNHASKDSVMFVGDTLHDLEVAETMGINCVLISNGHQSSERLASSSARVVDSVHELLALFN